MANAFSVNDIKSKLGWSNSFDRDGAFPLDLSSYFGSYKEAADAAKTAVEFGSSESKYYFGQQVYIFDGTNASTYLIQADRTLKELCDMPATIFVANEAEMLALVKLDPGQPVYREDTHTVWYFKGGVESIVSNWVEDRPDSECVWNGSKDRIIFYAATQKEYEDIATKSDTTVYFITDTGRIYKGNKELTSSFVATDAIPEVESAIIGKLYVDTNTFECKLTMDGKKWLVTSPGYLTDGIEWAAADSNKFATIGLIKKGIQESIDAGVANKVDKVNGVEDNLVVFGAQGAIKDSAKAVGGAEMASVPDSNTIATEAAVLKAIRDNELKWGSIN